MKHILYVIISIICFTIFSCSQQPTPTLKTRAFSVAQCIQLPIIDTDIPHPFEELLQAHGFVNLQEYIPSILIDLRYSTTHNFTGIDMYGDFSKAYTPIDVAQRLSSVQKRLQLIDSNYSLLVFDAVRPLSVQQIMWDSCGYKGKQRKNFLAHPSVASLHNYGAAIDVSLSYKGIELDMGTPFDYAGERAYTYIEQDLVNYGKISIEQLENRLLLRKVMNEQGFIENKYEWWHFGACFRKDVESKYPLVVSFDSIRPITKK